MRRAGAVILGIWLAAAWAAAAAAESDRSREVREGVVFAVSQVELPEAVDALIAIIKSK